MLRKSRLFPGILTIPNYSQTAPPFFFRGLHSNKTDPPAAQRHPPSFRGDTAEPRGVLQSTKTFHIPASGSESPRTYTAASPMIPTAMT